MSGAKRIYRLLDAFVNREWDRITGLERELAESELRDYRPAPKTSPPLQSLPLSAEQKEDTARLVLGVPKDARLPDIQRAYEKLYTRSDPSRFEAGTEERAKAETIRREVVWAYGQLIEHADVTDVRFSSLDID
ncbi:MAG: hypothetical protein ACK4P3_08640 [Fimbriimonadaceae bacterium]